jgi:hypothetical protein
LIIGLGASNSASELCSWAKCSATAGIEPENEPTPCQHRLEACALKGRPEVRQ